MISRALDRARHLVVSTRRRRSTALVLPKPAQPPRDRDFPVIVARRVLARVRAALIARGIVFAEGKGMEVPPTN